MKNTQPLNAALLVSIHVGCFPSYCESIYVSILINLAGTRYRCLQCSMKREAAESSIEQQLRDKEAIEAENAAALAKIAQNEAMVSPNHVQQPRLDVVCPGGTVKSRSGRWSFTLCTDRSLTCYPY